MSMPLNTSFIVSELEKCAEGGHMVGDVEAPVYLLLAAAERLKQLVERPRRICAETGHRIPPEQDEVQSFGPADQVPYGRVTPPEQEDK